MRKTYLDMDGVLARFEQEPNALERFANEPGFFANLRPTSFARELRDNNYNLDDVYILTASPNEQADTDKVSWVREHLPQLANRVITVRDGKDKAKYAKNNILIDDYTENLKFWKEKGGHGIKALNGHNGLTKRYKEYANTAISVENRKVEKYAI